MPNDELPKSTTGQRKILPLPEGEAGVRGKVTLALQTAFALPQKSADRPKGRMALSHSSFHASRLGGGR